MFEDLSLKVLTKRCCAEVLAPCCHKGWHLSIIGIWDFLQSVVKIRTWAMRLYDHLSSSNSKRSAPYGGDSDEGYFFGHLRDGEPNIKTPMKLLIIHPRSFTVRPWNMMVWFQRSYLPIEFRSLVQGLPTGQSCRKSMPKRTKSQKNQLAVGNLKNHCPHQFPMNGSPVVL